MSEVPKIKHSKKAEKALEKLLNSIPDDDLDRQDEMSDMLFEQFNCMTFCDNNRQDFLELGLELATGLQPGEQIFTAECPDGDAIYVRAKSEAELVRRIKALKQEDAK